MEVKYNFCSNFLTFKAYGIFVAAYRGLQKRLRIVPPLKNIWDYCKNCGFFSVLHPIPASSSWYWKIAITKCWYVVGQKILHKIYIFLKNLKLCFFSKCLFEILFLLYLYDFLKNLKNLIWIQKPRIWQI